MQKKEFGRYSRSHLRMLSQFLAQLERDSADLKERMVSDQDRLAELITRPFYWANLYQLPLLDLVFAAVNLLGLAPLFQAWATNIDPLATVIRELPNLEPETKVDATNTTRLLAILMALEGNFRAISFYSKSLEELTKEVGTGSEKAFFDAVLIDRTIMACSPFADRMAWAVYQGDETFFKTLASRLRQGVPSKKMKSHVPLRVCLYLLEQENCLASMTEKQAYDLLCLDLKLYSVKNGDPSRSLKRLIQRWQKDRAT